MRKNNNSLKQGRSVVGFDLGGTLVDESIPEFQGIPEHFINKFGLDAKTLLRILFLVFDALMKENNRQSNEQIPAKIIIKKVIEKLPYDISLEFLEEAAWYLLGANNTTYLKPLPYAKELLVELKEADTTIVALSNTAIPLSILKKIFDIHGIRDYFDSIILSSEMGWRKPSSEAFETMEKSINLTSEDKILFVGNSMEADIIPSINRGYTAAYINTSNKVSKDSHSFLSISVKTLKQLSTEISQKRIYS